MKDHKQDKKEETKYVPCIPGFNWLIGKPMGPNGRKMMNKKRNQKTDIDGTE